MGGSICDRALSVWPVDVRSREGGPPWPLIPTRHELVLTPPPEGEPDEATPPVVVGLRALKLGDFCCAVPAWKALRRARPEHRLVLAAPAWQRPLLALCPVIDELVPVAPLAELPSLIQGAELAVNLHGRGPQSTRLLAASEPRRLLAFAHPDIVTSAAGPAWDAEEHEVARWCRLLASSGIPADPAELSLDRPPQPAPVPRASVIHPGASAPARRWPVERWIGLARHLSGRGHRVVVTGTESEAGLTGPIAAAAGLAPAANLAGRLDLGALASLVADARLVVSGDTGVAHLASGYRIPSVVLFGPVSPAQCGPPTGGPHIALWAGRSGDPHGTVVDRGLLAIDVADVVDAVYQLPL